MYRRTGPWERVASPLELVGPPLKLEGTPLYARTVFSRRGRQNGITHMVNSRNFTASLSLRMVGISGELNHLSIFLHSEYPTRKFVYVHYAPLKSVRIPIKFVPVSRASCTVHRWSERIIN